MPLDPELPEQPLLTLPPPELNHLPTRDVEQGELMRHLLFLQRPLENDHMSLTHEQGIPDPNAPTDVMD